MGFRRTESLNIVANENNECNFFVVAKMGPCGKTVEKDSNLCLTHLLSSIGMGWR